MKVIPVCAIVPKNEINPKISAIGPRISKKEINIISHPIKRIIQTLIVFD